jgi:predicted nucleotidyltransferase component of viral defense system
MEKAVYKRQAALLLAVLPEIAKEKCFALHGGTAINLFVRNMPRLSVDVDLTYLPIEDRAAMLENVAAALERTSENILRIVPAARITHRREAGKLLISAGGVIIKAEVNLVARGAIGEPFELSLCAKAQDEFEVFCAVQAVSIGQLYGGKICAALDRQHPRDLFDVKYLLENEGFSDEIKTGFLYCLLSSDRPVHEIIAPNFQNQRAALENQFAGMTDEDFSYDEYESVRKKLVEIVREKLTRRDRQFLLSVARLKPDWSVYDFERFPSVRWKLHNLQKLKDANPDKFREQSEALEKTLGDA